MTDHLYDGRVYETQIEVKIAQSRDGNLTLPPLDFTCTGENCRCPHHAEPADD